MVLARLDQRDRHALASRAPHAPDAMHVRFRRVGQIVVDDVREVLDVEPARGDIGRDEELRVAGAQTLHHLVALLLRHAAVQRLGMVAARVHGLGELVHLGARAAEDDRRRRRFQVEDAAQRQLLHVALHEVGLLAHLRHLARLGRGLGDLDADRVALVLFRDRLDACRHRGREEHGLAILRRFGEHRLDVLGESHVEHLVGLVEHHHAHAAQLQAAAANVVERATRCRDHDVDARTQCVKLPADGLPAIHREHAHAERLAVAMHRLGDLHGKLARGHEHHRGGALALSLVQDPLQDRQREGRRLAGAGGRLPEEVLARDQRRDRLALDRRGLFVAEHGQGGKDAGIEAERGESAVL